MEKNALDTLPRGVIVDRDPNVLSRYLPAMDSSTSPSPLAVVRPSDESQILDLVRWANGSKCPLVPFSSMEGPDRRGVASLSKPAVVVDLSRMNRVIHADGKDHIAVIEPGVTFPRFDEALRSHGLRSFKPLLPRRTKSVLASYLDREPTTSPHDHWDSEDPVGGMQVVFGNGEMFRTGTAGVRGSLEDRLKKGLRQMMAVGPGSTDFLRVVQGSQGTLAIAAWASVYCEPVPAREKSFFVGSDRLQPVIDLAYRILWRRWGGQLFIVNGTQLAMIMSKGKDDFAQARKRLPRWILYVNLTALDYFPDERMAYLEADLEADAAAHGLLVGEHLEGFAAAAIGRMHDDLPNTHYKSRVFGSCRNVFFLTQLDKTPGFIDALTGVVTERSEEDRPLGIYLQPRVQGVNCHFEATIPFNPADEVAAEATARLAESATRRFAQAGAFFSRPHGSWSDIAYAEDEGIKPYLATVKELFDPNAILSPGRLCF